MRIAAVVIKCRLEVERQITRWMAELFQFPASASGLFAPVRWRI